jgi:paraquat-inducible protein A
MTAAPLIACHECDLLQYETRLPAGGVARCRRCGAKLYRSHPDSLDRTLAFTVGAAVLFAIANTFPIVTLTLSGQRIAATLYGAVHALYNQEMKMVAMLVFVTTILVPAIELTMMIYMLLPLRMGQAPPGLAAVFRLLQSIKPWGMVEVFMLGVLVSLVKLAHLAAVETGIALWSFAALMALMAAGAATFDPRDVWKRVEVAR